jgi:hypothetical protein
MKANRAIFTSLLLFAFVGVFHSQSRGRQVSGNPSSCGITLKIGGGEFSPQSCVFEIVTRGEACSKNAACPPDYALTLRDGNPSHVRELRLFNFRSLARQTFHFDPAKNLKDFNGEVLDDHVVVRHLLKGEVTLDPRPNGGSSDQRVGVSFDVSFSNGVRVQASGELPVRRIDAP